MHDVCRSVGSLIGRAAWGFGLISGLALLAFGGSQSAEAVTINVSYPHPADVPAAAMTEINNIVSFVDRSFINPATANITVDFTSSCGLGCSNTLGFTGVSYSTWRSAMIANSAANPQNTFLAAAVGTLPARDPIGNGTLGFLRVANGRALGFSVPPGTTDSNLTFNNGGGNPSNTFSFTGTPTPGLFDFGNTFEHELDEVLGVGSQLTNRANNSTLPTGFEPEDYFRYSSTPGVRSITTNPNAAVFFSYNGTTDVAQFNQDNNAQGITPFVDRNDWIYGNFGCPAAAPGPFVQDAIGCPDEVAPYGPGTPEFAVLETLGWNPPAAVPAPPIGHGLKVLLAVGGLLIGAKLLERRREGAGPVEAA